MQSSNKTSTFAQPQQYGDEVLPLALTEATPKGLKELAQGVGKTYNGFGNGSPLGQWCVDTYHLSPGKAAPASLLLVKCKDGGFLQNCGGRV